MGIFHTDFGANAVVPKFHCNRSVNQSSAMDGSVPVVGGGGGGASGPCPPGWKNKISVRETVAKSAIFSGLTFLADIC